MGLCNARAFEEIITATVTWARVQGSRCLQIWNWNKRIIRLNWRVWRGKYESLKSTLSIKVKNATTASETKKWDKV